MNLREITIGRSGNCDIYLDQNCKYASGLHATIYTDGSQLMYRDTSTNGTMINNVRIHKRAVPINRGDVIMVAGQYLINWNQIDMFFPNTSRPQMGTMLSLPQDEVIQARTPSNLNNWNWGAFCLYWLWGPFNGCWWTLIVYVFCCVCMFIPILGFFAWIGLMGTAIACGIKGNEWAWSNKQWQSAERFEQVQSTWSKVGVTLFLIGLFLSLISIVAIFLH